MNCVGNIKSVCNLPAVSIFTRDTHGEDYLSTPEGKKLPVVHCVKNTHGWQIADGLDVPDAIHIDKPSFGYTHWDKFCFEKIELVGLCTDICVVSNALILKAHFHCCEGGIVGFGGYAGTASRINADFSVREKCL